MNEIGFNAKIVIDSEQFLKLISQAGLAAGESNFPAEPTKKRGWPKGKKRKAKAQPSVAVPVSPEPVTPPEPTPAVTEPSPEPVEQVRLKIDGKTTPEDQIKSAILQAAIHTHGDAIARKIMSNWDAEDTNVVARCRVIFPSVRLEAIAKATMDSQPAILVKLPRTWLPTLFDAAAQLVARPVVQPLAEPVGCTICGNTDGHKAGCPMALLESTHEGDGGAMTAAMRRGESPAQPPAPTPEPEICALDGPKGGCPLPHATIFQGGAHIMVHPPELMARLRQATAAQTAPAPAWNAPAPPTTESAPAAPRKRGRPKKVR